MALVPTIGCAPTAGPTIPLPPPTALVSSPDADGFITIEGGGVIEGALISVFNENEAEGVIVISDDRGEFVARLRGAGGDQIAIWQRVGTDTGEVSRFIVPF